MATMIDLIVNILFESPLKLALVLFFVLLICLIVWRRRRTDRTRWVFLAAVGASIILVIAQGLITTDRERIRHVIDQLRDAVAQKDVAIISAYVDLEYALHGRDRDQVLSRIDAALRRTDVDTPYLYNVRITTEQDRGEASLTAISNVILNGTSLGQIVSAWRLEFVRRPSGWRVTGIDPVKVQGQNVRSLWDPILP
ncbi:MAG TPA: hypothetical protein VMZ31_05925 [Phycisphaerae bacterium]|nr:hypothetical protein [Phycisphaerae bacterium]